MTGTRQLNPPLVLGLLGGVAAGKSTVAAIFGEAGLVVLDADRKAHAVVRNPEVRRQLEARFGGEIFDADGQLDRQQLAKLVFEDPAARHDLEQITHPAIRRELLAELAAARDAGRSVVLDVPLLVEGGLIEACDVAVFVATTEATRQRRARDRGWDAEELARRESNQAPLEQKRRQCQFEVQNDGDLAQTRAQVQEILVQLASRTAPGD